VDECKPLIVGSEVKLDNVYTTDIKETVPYIEGGTVTYPSYAPIDQCCFDGKANPI